MSEILHIYTRVSTQAQKEEGTSLDSQKEQGIRKAKELGFEYQIWNEGGQSSSHDDLSNRPVLASLLDHIEAEEVKHLWVYNTDRLSRNDNTWSMIRLSLVKNTVTLYTNSGLYQLSNETDKFTLGILSLMSSYDNALRAERTRTGKVQRVKEGFWMGGPPPYGYKLINKKLEIDPDEAKWVRFIFEQFSKGQTVRWIRNKLLENKVMTRRKNPVWSLGSIEKLLTNTHYGGSYTYKDNRDGNVHTSTCPSLLPATLIIEAQKEKERRSKFRAKESNQKHFYLLRGLLRCDHCGAHFSARRYAVQKRSSYYCPRKERNYANVPERCDNSRYLKIEETDALIVSAVKEVLANSGLFKQEIRDHYLQQNQEQLPNKDARRKIKARIRTLTKDINDIRSKITILKADHLLEKTSNTRLSFMKVISEIQRRMLVAQAEKEKLEETLYNFDHQEQLSDWFTKYSERLNELDGMAEKECQKFLQGIIEYISVRTIDKRTHQLKIKFRLPYINGYLNPDRSDDTGQTPEGPYVKTLTVEAKKKPTNKTLQPK
ncbi:recombinase family protein [Ruficoccus sp. ZRK36]|uniref:recombinase family protein n=1 Tax=Ruficoccus sp. ZRK36 TaxID=2866311 RepID=UPI001C7361B4|nr:recombinase family protein [Ruficoccus sp. ZRK36]QYY36519.1 recombinase family protein [Ruficoccus sp. ZRK36]